MIDVQECFKIIVKSIIKAWFSKELLKMSEKKVLFEFIAFQFKQFKCFSWDYPGLPNNDQM